ncbi:unnamed protein product, partial [marine sediment metagenome]
VTFAVLTVVGLMTLWLAVDNSYKKVGSIEL